MGWPSEFNWRGTRDYSTLCALRSALAVRKQVGDEQWREYNDGLCKEVGQYYQQDRWPGSLMPGNNTYYSMVNVGPVPCNVDGGGGAGGCYSYTVGALSDHLFYEKGFSVTIYELEQGIFLRLSCQVYNYFEEYIALADTIAVFAESH